MNKDDRNVIRFVILGHNRAVGSSTENRNEREGTQNVNVENPNVGKTTAAHRLQNITMSENTEMGKQRGNDLLSPFFATRR